MKRRKVNVVQRSHRIGISRLGAALLGTLLCAPISAQVTQRVSVDSGGAAGNYSSRDPSVSADGRYVAFVSEADNLVPGDTNLQSDIFVHDRLSGAIERVSVDSSGNQGNTNSDTPSISADGRFVAFESYADNLVPGDTNHRRDVFVHDRLSGTTELVSVDSGGLQGDDISIAPSISADGRYVAFQSDAHNLVPGGDTNAGPDTFVHDRLSGTTERMSVDSGGVQGDGASTAPSISADGRYVAFQSSSHNLAPGADTNASPDIFVHDRLSGATERVSNDPSGAAGSGSSSAPSISADGRYVAFVSEANDLVPGDTNGQSDIFVHDRLNGTIERVSLDSGGVQANGANGFSRPPISADGRFVAFDGSSTNLVSGDTNGFFDVFVRDRSSGTTERLSVSSNGVQGDSDSSQPSISADGRYVAFDSAASNLVSGDTNQAWDVFLRDRNATGWTSLCDPGFAGVIGCPCANPPSTLGRGCDNSAATGGASLSASGIAYLSMDSLVFTTSGERATATSIVLQGTTSPPAGIIYGQGVRCVGGALKRLFVKSAVAGSITAPDFGAGDPTVSARSAAKGDVIQAGQSRWYLVYYRDPTVLGACPATSTFNATQTGRVEWSF
jgi:Tol biopolymer transport system component